MRALASSRSARARRVERARRQERRAQLAPGGERARRIVAADRRQLVGGAAAVRIARRIQPRGAAEMHDLVVAGRRQRQRATRRARTRPRARRRSRAGSRTGRRTHRRPWRHAASYEVPSREDDHGERMRHAGVERAVGAGHGHVAPVDVSRRARSRGGRRPSSPRRRTGANRGTRACRRAAPAQRRRLRPSPTSSRSSGVKWPTTKMPSVSAPDRIGDENDEKSTATAVITATSPKMSTIARTIVAVSSSPLNTAGAEREHGEQRQRHDRHQHGERQQHADVLAEDELPAMDRLRDEREHRLA